MTADLAQALISGLATGGGYALIALSFSVTYTTTKTLNFAEGDFISAGAFVGLTVLLVGSGMSISSASFGMTRPGILLQGVALVSACAGMGALGWLIYAWAIRPVVGRQGLAWVVSTIGFGIMLQSISLAIWGPKPMVVPGPLGDGIVRVFGIGIQVQEILLFAVTAICVAVVDHIIVRTRAGKIMRAVAFDPEVASLMGINVAAVMIIAFVVSCGLAGLSGFFLAPLSQVSIFMGASIGLKGFSGAMIGGLTSPRGCALGGLVLGLLESCVNLWRAEWREVAIFALVIVVMAIKPVGVFGKQQVVKV